MITYGSLFSGVGGADLGMDAAGMKCVFQVEKDPAAMSVLKYRWPSTIKHDDVCTAGAHNLPKVDVLHGSSPCQSFSVAGLRKGLGDERGNLMFEFCRICDELNPKIITYENVLGLLATKDNAFGCLLAALVGADAPLVPPRTIRHRWKRDKDGKEYFSWPDAGVVAGPKRHAAWRVFDSQYLGVAQRRDRVFVVVDTLGGCSEEILFKCEMRPRHTPPSRTEREETPAGTGGSLESGGIPEIAGTIGAHKTGGWGNELDNSGAFIPVGASNNTGAGYWTEGEVAGCLRSSEAPTQPQTVISGFRMTEFGGYVNDGSASSVKARDYKDATDLVAHTLKGEGCDGSEDDTGRGTPIVPVVGFDKSSGLETGDVSATLRCNGGRSEGVNDGKADNQCVAFDVRQITSKQNRSSVSPENPAPTLNQNGGVHVAGLMQLGHSKSNGSGISNGDVSSTLEATGTANQAVCFQPGNLSRKAGAEPNSEVVPTLGASTLGDQFPHVSQHMACRRLTPIEVERLQGWPDNWTEFGIVNGELKPQSDSARYRQVGNGVTSNVAEWIARRVIQYL